MKKCPKCAEKVQESAKKCKHCGSDMRNWFLRHKIISGFLILFVLGSVITALDDGSSTSSSTSSNTVTEKEEVIAVTARELYAAYEKNEIAADDQYKKKLLEVSGTVGSIGKDILDDMFVTLKTDNIFGTVQCMLEDSEKSKAASLNEGQSIVVQGRNDGKLGNILLRRCVIK
jgi:hypothetical protein